ncbi:hypothetical protein HDF13_003819 [Edaphobacter lichenicola]|uniref:Uncharacterized protein n=1 Tax=Tunturiibacter gelidiferens TaxID=3069689 RepID=A0ACC5P432_9BACT|nr:hypothetical protein [Edaphobacter lichenicola]
MGRADRIPKRHPLPFPSSDSKRILNFCTPMTCFAITRRHLDPESPRLAANIWLEIYALGCGWMVARKVWASPASTAALALGGLGLANHAPFPNAQRIIGSSVRTLSNQLQSRHSTNGKEPIRKSVGREIGRLKLNHRVPAIPEDQQPSIDGCSQPRCKSPDIFSSRQVRRYLPTQARRLGPQLCPEMKLAKENSILWGFPLISAAANCYCEIYRQNGGGGSPERTALPARFPAIRD